MRPPLGPAWGFLSAESAQVSSAAQQLMCIITGKSNSNVQVQTRIPPNLLSSIRYPGGLSQTLGVILTPFPHSRPIIFHLPNAFCISPLLSSPPPLPALRLLVT